MEKTKLGMSVGLTAALLYFLGLLNTVAMIVAVGYVLIAESNIWLKKSAIQATVIVVFFNLVSVVLGVGDNLFGIFNIILGRLTIIDYPWGIDTILLAIVSIVRVVLLLILGFMALGGKGFNLPVIGDFVDKHMGMEKPKPAAPVYQQPYQAQQPVQPTYQQPGVPAQQQQQQPYQYQQPVAPAAPAAPVQPEQPTQPQQQ